MARTASISGHPQCISAVVPAGGCPGRYPARQGHFQSVNPFAGYLRGSLFQQETSKGDGGEKTMKHSNQSACDIDGKADSVDTLKPGDRHPLLTAQAVPKPVDTRVTRRANMRKARAQSRATCRRASHTARLTMWWAALPSPRPDSFTPAALTVAMGHLARRTPFALRRLAPSLQQMGWRQIKRRVNGKQVALWLPPTSTLRPRPRGGQRIYSC